MNHGTPSQLLVDAMALCLLVGAVDAFRGGKWGLGPRFTEAFAAFGSLAVNMVGIITLVPLMQKYLAPLLAPVFTAIGSDPGIAPGFFLANDMGGYPLAHAMAVQAQAGDLGGMLLASMFGVCIVFNIPVALGVIAKQDRPFLARGMACAFVTMPLGCFAGALAAGFPLGWTLRCLLPVFVVSAAAALLLWKRPQAVTRVFVVLGRGVTAIALAGTAAGIFQALTGFVLVPGLAPVSQGFDVVVSIIMLLPGAYVLVELLSRLLKKPFARLGKAVGINQTAALGLMTTLANAIPTFSMVKDMDNRGKVVNFAFLASCGYLLGDHLAFCTAVDASLVLPLLAGKLVSGLSAAALALVLVPKASPEGEEA